MKKHKTIPIFVPHMGCPNDCSFCNQRKITGCSDPVTPEFAGRLIERSLKTMPKDADVEVGFFGGSFTGIEKPLQRQYLSTAYQYIKAGGVKAIRVSTRPDYIDETTVPFLQSYGVTTVELGAQSMDNHVLFLNRRGHTCEDTIRASNIIRAGGMKLGLQMMTGLYGDTRETCLESAKKIIALSPACVRIYPTLVLKGTYLDELCRCGRYAPQELEEAVLLCADLKQMFDRKGISVIRLGLMTSDNINPEKDVSAGPYHSSFGELVQSEIYFRRLKEAVKEDCWIAVHPRTISAYLGNKRENVDRLKQLGFHIKFVQDGRVLPGSFKLVKKKGGGTCV